MRVSGLHALELIFPDFFSAASFCPHFGVQGLEQILSCWEECFRSHTECAERGDERRTEAQALLWDELRDSDEETLGRGCGV